MATAMSMSLPNFKSSFFSSSVFDNNDKSSLNSQLMLRKIKKKKKKKQNELLRCELPFDWKLSDSKKKAFIRRRRLSDDNARRIIKEKAIWESQLRKNQGCEAKGPNCNWIKRTPPQMAQYLNDDRHGHIYPKHVVAAIKIVRQLASKPAGSYNIRHVLSSFIGRFSFREMCIVLKEQRGWRPATQFFGWMKLQPYKR